MVAFDIITISHATEKANTQGVKEDLLAFLKKNVCDKPWEGDAKLKPLLEAIEELMAGSASPAAASRGSNTTNFTSELLTSSGKASLSRKKKRKIVEEA